MSWNVDSLIAGQRVMYKLKLILAIGQNYIKTSLPDKHGKQQWMNLHPIINDNIMILLVLSNSQPHDVDIFMENEYSY